MTNQQFKALGRKYQVLPKFRDLLQGARKAKSSEVSAHSCAVSALSGQRIPHQPFENLETVLNTIFDVMNIVLSVEGKPSSDDKCYYPCYAKPINFSPAGPANCKFNYTNTSLNYLVYLSEYLCS